MRVICRAIPGLALVLSLASSACKDEDPCDPGQRASEGFCYAAAQGGAAGSGGSGPPGDAGGVPGAPDTDFGTPCADVQGSTDCGGRAPVCVPFPAGSSCSQLHCEAGEANAGACPGGYVCVRSGDSPSVCFGTGGTAP